jgi:hypothetical protein
LATGKATKTGRRQDDGDLGSLVSLGMLGIVSAKFRTFYKSLLENDYVETNEGNHTIAG